MTRAELIDILANKQPQTPIKQIEQAVKLVFDHMSEALENGQRIEIRGFGSFALRYRSPRVARNPKTGEYVNTEGKYVAHFKPGKELRERVNEAVKQSE
ncbi:integration host factor subunit beta [Candidatus Berkiella cookevillensis]|uniref:Integration host factor subunit beta n=1 Tax=Candidatus Berkiella cookevillensis TaxID=437022 RepID=A0A0Q9YD43_9GAMM|nr:integration host factor subunit beta [Candidatus Berkiella cookevillensis]MCS5709521.1 integration host factor subunit beta [Candidatus Berkiella cookevillensis]